MWVSQKLKTSYTIGSMYLYNLSQWVGGGLSRQSCLPWFGLYHWHHLAQAGDLKKKKEEIKLCPFDLFTFLNWPIPEFKTMYQVSSHGKRALDKSDGLGNSAHHRGHNLSLLG